MGRGVTIKGSGNGVVLVLDPDMEFDDLKKELKKRISDASDFFRDSSFPIRVRGREFSGAEQQELLDIVRKSARVQISEFVFEPPVRPKKLSAEEVFSGEDPEDEEDDRQAFGDTEELSMADRAILKELEKHLSGDFAILHTGPVKNGEVIRSEYSLVIMGDVRVGGCVEATGSVYVLGSLYGDVIAGSDGNRSAIVMSGNLKPRSLSIGSLSGYHVPPRARKLPFGKKRLMEVACVKNGEVVRMPYGDFIKENLLA
ncbi:MAG: hypothetical protein K6C95_10585 [Lachnospiraceae bacterium]|nr:hypothetical protein [Lachnospiraceae bacterium]